MIRNRPIEWWIACVRVVAVPLMLIQVALTSHYPNGDKTDQQTVYGHSIAATTVQVLKQCGNDLTRENVMKEAANLHDLALPMLLPGISVNTSPTNFAPIRQAQMRRFDGERYVPFGPVLSGVVG